MNSHIMEKNDHKLGTKGIYVESEFASLKKVVIAQSEFGSPQREMNQQSLDFLTPEDREFLNFRGKDHGEAYPERQKAWELERENFEKVLSQYGVEVFHPRKLTQAEKEFTREQGYSNFFSRDPFFTVGNFVVEGSLRLLHRRYEVLPVREVMKTYVMEEECMYIAAPQPEIPNENDTCYGAGPFIEGGDVVILGKHVFVGMSGLASNAFGVKWLRKLLSPFGYTVEDVRLKSNILHLDCALSLVREGLMIVCPSAFLDGIPKVLENWDRIYVTEEEATRLATNGLPINADTYVTDPEFRHIGHQLENYGVKVEYVDFSITRSFGGSFRCSTQPLLRKNECEKEGVSL